MPDLCTAIAMNLEEIRVLVDLLEEIAKIAR